MGGIKKLFDLDIGDHRLSHAKGDGGIAPPFAGDPIIAMAGAVKSGSGRGLGALPGGMAHIGG